MRPIEPNVEPNSDPRCAHRETTTDNGLPYTVIDHVDACACATGLIGAASITQLPPMAELYCGVQVERDGRHAIIHAPDCDGTRCGIDLIELPSDHDPRAYDHLRDAGTITIPVALFPNASDAAAYAAMLADPGTPNWGAVVLAAGRLYTELTGRTLPAPDVDDTPEHAARARLGTVGAAIGLELLHYVIDTDDEQPLEAAAAELREHGDIPESVVVAIAPVVASVLNTAIDAIETARKHQEPTP
jgi:hypothetical protein